VFELTKVSSKWITNINVKHKTSRKIGENLQNLALGKEFLHSSPKVQSTKGKFI
jgi:hypothetical protein